MKYTKILGSVALATLLVAGFTGCGSDDSNDNTPVVQAIQPYQRVLSIPGTSADINDIATKIAEYVINTNEKDVLGFPSDWVIAGANIGKGETNDGLKDMIPIPAWNKDLNATYKTRVIEFCNGAYATQATNTGQLHGSALPCEVAVHSDGTNVYVDMLDATAIFSIFFPEVKDPTGNLEKMAADVKSELRKMILTSLDGEVITESTKLMGPKFTAEDIKAISDKDIYIVTSYKKNNDSSFTKAEAKQLAEEIIAKLGTDAATADKNVNGLSAGSAWRAARPEPIPVPGVFITEACSPTYAKMATKLGSEYISALPCEITTYLDKNDDTNKTISVSILSPKFMFENMFKGAVEASVARGDMNETEAATYAPLAQTVLDDLNKILNAAVKDSPLGITAK